MQYVHILIRKTCGQDALAVICKFMGIQVSRAEIVRETAPSVDEETPIGKIVSYAREQVRDLRISLWYA